MIVVGELINASRTRIFRNNSKGDAVIYAEYLKEPISRDG